MKNRLMTVNLLLATLSTPGFASDDIFTLINVEYWEDAESFQAVTKKIQAEAVLPKIGGIKPNPALYKIIRRD